MYNSVSKLVQSVSRPGPPTNYPSDFLNPFYYPSDPGHMLSMTSLLTSRHLKVTWPYLLRYLLTILTIIDCFSKACQLISLPKLPTAMETAEVILKEIFRFYGFPEDVVSDRGFNLCPMFGMFFVNNWTLLSVSPQATNYNTVIRPRGWIKRFGGFFGGFFLMC